MAKVIIGYVTKVKGRYLARDDAGSTRELNLGDPIYDTDIIFGANADKTPTIEVKLLDGSVVQNSGPDLITSDFFSQNLAVEKIETTMKEDEERVQALAKENNPNKSPIPLTKSIDSNDARLEVVGKTNNFIARDTKEVRASSTLRDTEFNRFIPNPDGNVPRSTTSGGGNPPPEGIDDFDTVIHETDAIASGNILRNDTSVQQFDLDVQSISSDATGEQADFITDVNASINGAYGRLDIDLETGDFTYTLDNRLQAIIDLNAGESFHDIFPYTNVEEDGDTASATLDITILGKSEGAPSLVVGDGSVQDDFYDTPSTGTNTVTNTLDFLTPDGFVSIKIGDTIYDQAGLDALAGITVTMAGGVLTFDSYSNTGLDAYNRFSDHTITYTYVSSGAYDHNGLAGDFIDSLAVVLIDGADVVLNSSIDITIEDDLPTTQADTNWIQEGTVIHTISGDVFAGNDNGFFDPGTGQIDYADEADHIGADDDSVANDVIGVVVSTDTSTDASGNIGTALVGQYGTLTMLADGTYDYVLDGANPNIKAMIDGESLDETFVYTIRDSDGDTSTTTLTITVHGNSSDPTLDIDNGEVYEAGIDVIGTDASAISEFVSGRIQGITNDVFASVTIGGTVLNEAALNAINTTPVSISTSYGTLELTKFTTRDHPANPAVKIGVLEYTYELEDAVDSTTITSDDITIVLLDQDGKSVSEDLVITIHDDAPIANDDDALNPVLVVEGGATVNGNVINDGEGDDLLGADEQWGAGEITEFTFEGITQLAGTTITGASGATVTLNADGSWVYDASLAGLDQSAGNVASTFDYVLEDADGSTSTATQFLQVADGGNSNINIVADDSAVDEDNIVDTILGNITITSNDDIADVVFNSTTVQAGLSSQGEAITYSLSADAHVLTATAGSREVFTLTLADTNTKTPTYTFVLSEPIDHVYGDDGKDVLDLTNFSIEATDIDGSIQSDTFDVAVTDTINTTVLDTANITEGDPASQSVSGNILSNDTLDADTSVATGLKTGNDVGVDADGGINSVLVGNYGSIVVQADGSYTYTVDNSNPLVQALVDGQSLDDEFVYTITDFDGDKSTTTLVVTIDGETFTPSISADAKEVDEQGIAIIGSNALDGTEVDSGTIVFYDGNGLAADAGAASGNGYIEIEGTKYYRDDLTAFDGSQTLATSNGTITFTGFSYDMVETYKGTITYDYTLNTAADHSDGAVEDNVPLTVVDVTGNSNSATLDVNIIDDAPIAQEDDQPSPIVIIEGDVSTGSPNVINDGEGDDILGADQQWSTIVVQDFTFEGITQLAGTTITGASGAEVTLNADGSWVYDATNASFDNDLAPIASNFDYTIVDGDGSSSVSTQYINVSDRDDASMTPAAVTVEEDGFYNDDPLYDWDATGAIVFDTNDAISDITFDVAQTTTLLSFGNAITYTLSDSDHLLTAKDSLNNDVFTVQLNNTADKDNASYTFTLIQGVDHPDALDKNTVLESLDITAVDSDGGNSLTGSLDVTIIDSLPTTGPILTTIDEDNAGEIIRIADGFENGEIIIDGTTLTDATPLNVTDAQSADVVGTVVNNGDGTITFTPSADYSGVAEFTYGMSDFDGDPGSGSITVTVNPIADGATTISNNVTHNEDNSNTQEGTYNFDLLLDASSVGVRDDTDEAPSSTNDTPERMGVFTLEFTSGEGELFNGGTKLGDITGSESFQFYISDAGFSANGLDLTGVTTLTKAEYEALSFTLTEDSAVNVDYLVSKNSHEVDSNGDIYSPDIISATVQDNGNIDVLAVTDPVSITLVDTDGVGSDVVLNTADKATIKIDEDQAYNLQNLLDEQFGDMDFSERHFYEIDVLPAGAKVIHAGTSYVSDGSTPIRFQFENDEFDPSFKIKPPKDFAGEMNGVSVTLVAEDSDTDSDESAIVEETDTIILDFWVYPKVDGDVTIKDTTTLEDTATTFLNTMKIDQINAGSPDTEVTAIVITVPVGWVLKDEGGVVLVLDGSNQYTIDASGSPITDISTTVFKDYTLTPAAHSSLDQNVSIDVTATQTVTIDSVPVTDTKVITLTPEIEVTPVAEVKVDDILNNDASDDTDGNTIQDIITQGDNTYEASDFADPNTLNEDSGIWIDLNVADFTLAVSDEDSSESVNIRFANVPIGTQFSVDGGSTVLQVSDVSQGIQVPLSELANVTFKPPANFSGDLAIYMSVITTDIDEDATGQRDANESIEDVLNFTILPIADEATILVKQAIGDEDAGRSDIDTDVIDGLGIALDVTITSSDTDGSESHNLQISDIPDGSTLFYNNVEIYSAIDTSGSIEIIDFDNAAQFSYVPIHNSNEDVALTIRGVTVDGRGTVEEDIGAPSEPISLDIFIKGVADNLLDDDYNVLKKDGTVGDGSAEEDYAAVYTEEGLEDGSQVLKLSDFFINTPHGYDADGSELIVFSIAFPEQYVLDGFGVEGGNVTFSPTDGYTVALSEIDNVHVLVPENFSGELTIGVRSIVTENDGDTNISIQTFPKVWIEPSVDSEVAGTVVQNEDESVNLAFSLDNKGDSNEDITAVFIQKAEYDARSDISLTIGDAGADVNTLGTQDIDGVLYYRVDDVTNIYSHISDANSHLGGNYGVTVRYELEDTVNDGIYNTGGDVTSKGITLEQDYRIHVHAVADKPTMDIDDDDGIIEVPGTGTTNTVIVNFTIQSDDQDGSEHHTRYRLEGVPDGITIDGGSYAGGGTWYLNATGPTDGSGLSTQGISFTYGPNVFNNAFDNYTMTIFGYNEDAGDTFGPNTVAVGLDPSIAPFGAPADPPPLDGDENVSDGFDFEMAWDGNGGGGEPVDDIISEGFDEITINDVTLVEDVPFLVSDLITVVQTDPAEFLTINISGLPAGTEVSGAQADVIDGEAVWVVTNYATAKITLIEHMNDNNDAGRLDNIHFHVISTPAGGIPGPDGEVDAGPAVFDVTPVTDPLVVSSVIDYYDELDADVDYGEEDGYADIDISYSLVDAPFGNIVNESGGIVLFFKVSSDEGVSGKLVSSADHSFEYPFVGGHWQVPETAIDNITFLPDAGVSGTVVLSVDVYTQEDNASNIEQTIGQVTLEFNPIAEDMVVIENALEGYEDEYIFLDLDYASLDTDGSEVITDITLTVSGTNRQFFYGEDGAQILAQNISDGTGTETFKIPVVLGEAIPKIWFKQIENSDINQSSVQMKITSHETNEDGSLIKISEAGTDVVHTTTHILSPIVVKAKADGLQINPTISLGNVGTYININLNAAMLDLDGSETMTLEVIGLGENALFQVDGVDFSSTYDAGSDTYTLVGIEEDKINSVSVVVANATAQTMDITVNAKTVETDSDGDGGAFLESTVVSGNFELTINDVLASNSDDTIIFDPNAETNGYAGEDTMLLLQGQNIDFSALGSADINDIEIIDLIEFGDHSISNMKGSDLVNMTDADNLLSINGDAGDSISLKDEAGDVWYEESAGVFKTTLSEVELIVNGISPSFEREVATENADTLVYDGVNAIDGLGGQDTLILLPTVDVDFSTINGEISNFKTIDLSNGGDHTLSNIGLDDVLSISDGVVNHLSIKGDSGDSVDFSNDGAWEKEANQVEVDGVNYDVYTRSDDLTVKVNVQEDIVQSI